MLAKLAAARARRPERSRRCSFRANHTVKGLRARRQASVERPAPARAVIAGSGNLYLFPLDDRPVAEAPAPQLSESVDGAPENGMIRGLQPVVSVACAWHAACTAG